jgi:gliding motility-associated-like protein
VVVINPASNTAFTTTPTSCLGTTITFTPTVAGGTFTVNGAAITGNTFTPTAGGNYNVTYTVTSAQGCVSTSAAQTVVVGTPNLGLTAGPDTANASPGATVSFTAQATSTGGVFTWTGNGVTVTGATLTLTDVQETGTYTVTYTLNGCSETRTVVLRVNKVIFVPNLFSPNGDGSNDKLFIYGYNISNDDFSFQVFNRYGGQVYSTSNPNDVCFHLNPNGGWDGGSLPTDVYNYVLKGKLTNGTEIKVEGRNTGSIYLQK